MKITKIEIRNYRSLQDVTIFPKSTLSLIGGNNSGKSSILKALELFFEATTSLVSAECFYGHFTENPIQILLTFEHLSSWEKDQFKPWMDGEKLVVGREIVCEGEDSYVINTIAVVTRPELDWLQEDTINGDRIKEWWPNRGHLKVGDLDFGARLGSSKPSVGEWKEAAKQFVAEHPNEIPMKKDPVKNPKGYPGVLKGALPEFIFIHAVREVSDETKVTKTNPFGQLINSFFELVPGADKDVLTKQIQDIERRLNRSGKEARFVQIQDLEKRMNELMSELMECDVEIEITMPQFREILGAAKIYADDGIRTTIETKGHGMQRYMIFTILRAYAELSHVRKAAENAKQRTTIFAIEEPEIYLHPQSQRTLMSVFTEIANGTDQIIYCTHSSLFVDIGRFDEICIMRREKKANGYQSYPSQLFMSDMIEDLLARKGVQATEEGIRERYSHAFNPMINEGFFAEKVVIVEGPSEQYSLPIYADCLGYDLNRNNVSVVHSEGKGQMDRLLRVFSGFKIPVYAWFDGDKTNPDKDVTDKTLELMQLFGESISKIDAVATKVTAKYSVLEKEFEDLLKNEISDYDAILLQAAKTLGPTGKPLKNRFVAKTIKQRVNDGTPVEEAVPKTIKEIVEKIQGLSFSGGILQKKAQESWEANQTRNNLLNRLLHGEKANP
jgi:predicted ATP-dependent endonuclease of OLD family